MLCVCLLQHLIASCQVVWLCCINVQLQSLHPFPWWHGHLHSKDNQPGACKDTAKNRGEEPPRVPDGINAAQSKCLTAKPSAGGLLRQPRVCCFSKHIHMFAWTSPDQEELARRPTGFVVFVFSKADEAQQTSRARLAPLSPLRSFFWGVQCCTHGTSSAHPMPG